MVSRSDDPPRALVKRLAKVYLRNDTAIVPVLWGSTYVVTRQWLPADMPLTGAAIRALPAGLLLLAIAVLGTRVARWPMSTAMIYLAIGGVLGAIGWISTVFTLNNLAAFALWTLAGDRLAAGFRDAVAARRMNLISGALLAGVALWMLVT